jgi:hypothetical protein
MTRELSIYEGTVVRVDERGSWIRNRMVGEICARGVTLSVGETVRFSVVSDSGGEFARVAGATGKGMMTWDNSDLTWSANGGAQWTSWGRSDW